jgi:hypothetical protein
MLGGRGSLRQNGEDYPSRPSVGCPASAGLFPPILFAAKQPFSSLFAHSLFLSHES